MRYGKRHAYWRGFAWQKDRTPRAYCGTPEAGESSLTKDKRRVTCLRCRYSLGLVSRPRPVRRW